MIQFQPRSLETPLEKVKMERLMWMTLLSGMFLVSDISCDEKDNFAEKMQLAKDLSLQLETKLPEIPDASDLLRRLIDTVETLSGQLSPEVEAAFKQVQELLKKSKTCADLANIGITQSGRYRLQPNETLEPIMVLCDFENGTTEILHNMVDQEASFQYGQDRVRLLHKNS